MRQVAVAGCVEGMRNSNIASYAAQAQQSGSGPELAQAEAEVAVGKLQPVFEDGCKCILADLLSDRVLTMTKEDFVASVAQRAAVCVPNMMQAAGTPLDEAELETYQAKLRAGLETYRATSASKTASAAKSRP